MNYLSLLVAALALSVGVDCVSPPPSIDKDFGPAIGRFTVEWSQGKVTICNSYLGFFFVDLNAPRANNYVEVVCEQDYSTKLWPLLNGSQKGIVLECKHRQDKERTEPLSRLAGLTPRPRSSRRRL
ncbi:uncharacterized protein PSFLO_03280 [Pseudozyma flocculosa]|uniref:Uncharacterized protein n=1 Tax=Pseudozyma flocculosa TaxID=84751 RepID=A0A5C3EZV5_9BASI|nr:uncharacterized protein PSFLO_03280 [Pseudozyma flocculosa]